MIDPLYVASGFGVDLLVGMTGAGSGSLMTPLGTRQGENQRCLQLTPL
jgi:hypothetical protein